MEKRVTKIPADISKIEKKVVIYARVSTENGEQLNSLTTQISGLTRMVATVRSWRLVDVYIDIESAKGRTHRKEFTRMIEDGKDKKYDIVFTKNISRFGRDTVETLKALKVLLDADIRVKFEQENLDSGEMEDRLMITIIESLAQAENESRSENIKWGIMQKVAQGTSKLADRKCYGYNHDDEGNLIINEEQAVVVKKIFNLYLGGTSVNGVIKELEKHSIKSSTGKDRWCKGSIENMLKNRKYTGEVELLKQNEDDAYFLASDNNPVIIATNVFDEVQRLRKKRSNVTIDENGNKIRSSKKYSSKNK